jgi:hypothetical protein
MSEETTPQQEIIQVKASISDEFIKQMSDEYTKQMQQLAPLDAYNIDVNGSTIKFKRRKIYSKERRELEVLRQKLNKAASTNSSEYPNIEDKLYKTMAKMYLIDSETNKGMTEEQFDSTVYEDIKAILNACAFRTERPIPSPFEMTS